MTELEILFALTLSAVGNVDRMLSSLQMARGTLITAKYPALGIRRASSARGLPARNACGWNWLARYITSSTVEVLTLKTLFFKRLLRSCKFHFIPVHIGYKMELLGHISVSLRGVSFFLWGTGVCRFSFRFTGFFWPPPPFGSLKNTWLPPPLNLRDVPLLDPLKNVTLPPPCFTKHMRKQSVVLFLIQDRANFR